METEPAASTDSDTLVGETIAERFLVEHAVAEGGFGAVYRARQIGLDRPVALKILKPAARTPAFQDTFEAEARTIARLVHPNIVTVHDFGVARTREGPLPWIALEWLDGRTLEAWLAERRDASALPLDPEAALALLRPVFEAMSLAHQRGVVHGDLKPANIFLQQQSGIEVPKVVDFGLARMVSPDRLEPTTGGATTRAFSAFSPEYAAPEQVTHGRTGPWTDVHALGLILTEVLTGRPPYEATAPENPGDGPYESVISPQRPTPGSKGVGVGKWERVLARAVARRPGDRQANAGDLLADLERELPAGVEPAPSPAPQRRIYRRWLAAGLSAALALAAIGVWQSLRPASSNRVMLAVLPFENLTGDRQQDYLSDGLTEGLIAHLGQRAADQLGVIEFASVAQYRGRQKAIASIADELGVDYLLQSDMQRTGDRLHIETRLLRSRDQGTVWTRAIERDLKDAPAIQAELGQAIAATVELPFKAEAAGRVPGGRSANPAAYDAYLRGRYLLTRWPEAGTEWRKAGDHFEQAIALDPNYAAAYAALAEYLGPRGLGHGPRAKSAALRALELDERLPEAHRALANVLLAFDWDWAGAERHYRRALALNPNDGEAHKMWARIPLSTGRFAEGIAARKRASELSPQSWDAHAMVAAAYYNARQFDVAIDELRRIFAMKPDLRLAHYHLASCYLAKARFAEALAVIEKCRPRCLGVKGMALAGAGRSQDAQSVIQELKDAGNPESTIDIARIYAALGRRDDTFVWLEASFRDRHRELIFLRVDPKWDRVRDDPRFEELIRRVGIPPLAP